MIVFISQKISNGGCEEMNGGRYRTWLGTKKTNGGIIVLCAPSFWCPPSHYSYFFFAYKYIQSINSFTHNNTKLSYSSTLSLCIYLPSCSVLVRASHCMAATNSSSRGITALGKRVVNQIWNSNSPSPALASRYPLCTLSISFPLFSYSSASITFSLIRKRVSIFLFCSLLPLFCLLVFALVVSCFDCFSGVSVV